MRNCPHAKEKHTSKDDEVGNLALDATEGEGIDDSIVYLYFSWILKMVKYALSSTYPGL